MIEKVNDDVCAIESEVINNALVHLMGGINLNENTCALDKHVVLKNSNYMYELHNFPPFVLVNKDIATHVARALDDVSIKTYMMISLMHFTMMRMVVLLLMIKYILIGPVATCLVTICQVETTNLLRISLQRWGLTM